MCRGTWWAALHGVAKRWSRLSTHGRTHHPEPRQKASGPRPSCSRPRCMMSSFNERTLIGISLQILLEFVSRGPLSQLRFQILHCYYCSTAAVTIAAADDDALKKRYSGLYTEILPKKIIQIKYSKTIKNLKVTS